MTVIGEAIREGDISMVNVTETRDATVGKYTAKILTTFSQSGDTGYTIILLDEEAGYWFFIYGGESGLSLEELEKIGEKLTYEVVEDAPDENVDTTKEDDGTLNPVKVSYASLNPDTQKTEVITEEIAQKYVTVNVTLYNPTEIDLTDFYFQEFIIPLKKAENGYQEDELPISYNEPVYLSFADYGGKSSFRMNLAAGETRELTAVYLVDEKNLENDYLRFDGLYEDGSGKCCF